LDQIGRRTFCTITASIVMLEPLRSLVLNEELENALQNGCQAASAMVSVFSLTRAAFGRATSRTASSAKFESDALGGEECRVLRGERVLRTPAGCGEIILGQRLQINAPGDGEASLHFGNEV